jgi:threonine/homoserine/homoserine lactone efflux protein
MASGLGIALAECCCGALTVFGIASLTTFIENNHQLLQLIASLFLFYFGVATLKTKRKEEGSQVVESGYFRVFFMMFILTLTNPLTLLSFVAIFSAMGIETLENDLIAIGLLSAGVFIGSTAWWALVSSSSSYFLGKIRSSSAQIMNKIVGIAIIIVSIFSFVLSLKSLLTD